MQGKPAARLDEAALSSMVKHEVSLKRTHMSSRNSIPNIWAAYHGRCMASRTACELMAGGPMRIGAQSSRQGCSSRPAVQHA